MMRRRMTRRREEQPGIEEKLLAPE